MTAQEYELVKALKDIAYELKRIADAIDEEKERRNGKTVDRQPPKRK